MEAEDDRDKPWNFHTCKLCTYRSKSSFLMCNHVRLHRIRPDGDTFNCDSKTPEMFECEICEFNTDLKVNLYEHVSVFHEEKKVNTELVDILKRLRCRNCVFETQSVLVLAKHVFKTCNNMPGNSFKAAELKRNRNRGRKNQTTFHQLKCQHCSFETNQTTFLKVHKLAKHEDSEDVTWFKCDRCPFQTKWKSYLKSHKRDGDCGPKEENWFKDKQCSIQTKWEDYFKLPEFPKQAGTEDGTPEMLLGKFESLFECEQCPFRAKTKGNLKTHVYIKHEKLKDMNWFRCKQCSFKTKQKGILKTHIYNKHMNPEDINWFKCGQCPYRAKHKGLLKTHISKRHLKT